MLNTILHMTEVTHVGTPLKKVCNILGHFHLS